MRCAWTKTKIRHSPDSSGAMTRDSVRGVLYVALANRIGQYKTTDGSFLRQSDAYSVDTWKSLAVDDRTSTLFMCGISGSNYKISSSNDGGMTGKQVLMLSATNSAAIATDSDRGALIVIYGDTDNKLWVRRSYDAGAHWESASQVKTDSGTQFVGTIGSLQNDERNNGALFMLLDAGAGNQLYRSYDCGSTFKIISP